MGNLFDVKLRAIENLHEAGVEIILVMTIVNNVNNDQVGPIVKFAMENPKKISFVAFQPVSFTGRDEDITPERRMRQRYTLSHLANDVSTQVGKVEPTRDWFPISFIATFAGFADLSHGPDSQWGSVCCGCHPNCGVGTALMINKETKEWAPVPRFLDVPSLIKDVTEITDAARGKRFSNFMMGLALLKNYKPFEAPPSLPLMDLWRKFDKSWALSKDRTRSTARRIRPHNRRRHEAPQEDPWNFLFIAGMWFQDLFNYDFRRTEMCIIPYATQKGEISFCAYNTGIGWRKIIENMHKNATVAEWYKKHGKHEIYAKSKKVNLDHYEHSLKIDSDDAARVRELEHDIPLTAAEEDRMRRKKAFEEAAKVRTIYEELVLKKKSEPLMQIGIDGRDSDGGSGRDREACRARERRRCGPGREVRSCNRGRRLIPFQLWRIYQQPRLRPGLFFGVRGSLEPDVGWESFIANREAEMNSKRKAIAVSARCVLHICRDVGFLPPS